MNEKFNVPINREDLKRDKLADFKLLKAGFWLKEKATICSRAIKRSTAFQTFNDTRSAIQQISNIVNENIVSDTSTPPPVTSGSFVATTASSNDQSNLPSNVASVNATTTATMSTTTTKPQTIKLTRSGLQNLIRRNLRGLVRLFNIEWQDALNVSCTL